MKELFGKVLVVFVMFLQCNGETRDGYLDENLLDFLKDLFGRLYCSRIITIANFQLPRNVLKHFSARYLMVSTRYSENIFTSTRLKNTCELALFTSSNIYELPRRVLNAQWMVVVNNDSRVDTNLSLTNSYNVIFSTPISEFNWELRLLSSGENYLIGHWDYQSRKLILSEKIPLKNQAGIENYKMKVALIEYPPTMEITMDENNSIVVNGFVGELLNILSTSLNLTFVYFEADDGEFGSLTSNFTWTGIVGKLIANEAHIGPAVTWTPDRRNAIDFSSNIYKVAYRILYRNVHKREWNWMFYLRPFTGSLWICLFFVNCAVVFFFYCATRRGKNLSGGDREEFFLCWPAVNLNRSIPRKASTPCLFLSISFLICSFVLFSSYASKLTALLAVHRDVVPFESLEDMLERGEYFPVLIRGTSFLETFSSATDEPLKSAWKLIQTNKNAIVDDFESGVDTVYENKAGFLTAVKDVESLIRSNCSFAFSPKDVRDVTASFAYNRHFPYQELINVQILKAREFGILSHLRGTYYPALQPCLDTNLFQAVSTHEIFVLIVLLAGALFLSLLTLALEVTAELITRGK